MSVKADTRAEGSKGGKAGGVFFGRFISGTSEPRTRATSCIVGLSPGCFLVHRSASWNTFFTAPRSLQVAVTSGSTVSMTALLAAFDRICTINFGTLSSVLNSAYMSSQSMLKVGILPFPSGNAGGIRHMTTSPFIEDGQVQCSYLEWGTRESRLTQV